MYQSNRPPRRRRRGFTLIEVLLVMAILVILAGLVTVSYINIQKNSQINAVKAQIGLFEQALDTYRLNVGTYPSTAQGLAALQQPPPDLPNPSKWLGPYITKQIPLDPWDSPYQYELLDVDTPRIWSVGPDQTDNTEDDIDNLTFIAQ
jgi:general secretion pathway protein G